MRINKKKLYLKMAQSEMGTVELCKKAGMSYSTYKRALTTDDSRPKVIGRIAKALGVDVSEIVEE